MVWGCFCSSGVGSLCFIEGTVNATVYQNILEKSMLKSAEELYGESDSIFQQDNAPPHTAQITSEWLKNQMTNIMK